MGNVRIICMIVITVLMAVVLLVGVGLYLFKSKMRYKVMWGQISPVFALVLIGTYLLLFGGARTEVIAREVSVTKVYNDSAVIEWTDSYNVTYVYRVATEDLGKVHSGDKVRVNVQANKNVFGVTVIETPTDLFIFHPRENHIKRK